MGDGAFRQRHGAAEKFRCVAGAPDVEYALSLLTLPGNEAKRFGADSHFSPNGTHDHR